MKRIVVFGLLLMLCYQSIGQLVRRVDYDAAFALQAGGELGMLAPFGHKPGVFVQPTGGLKMTFPFTRKWFLGMEINYSNLKYGSQYDAALRGQGNVVLPVSWEMDMKAVQVPVYLKCMLRNNKSSVLFGGYGSYVFDGELQVAGETVPEAFTGKAAWNAGITLGFEQQIVKHFNAMVRVSAGGRDILQKEYGDKRFFPVQACVTLSYDILRIGDCGCD